MKRKGTFAGLVASALLFGTVASAQDATERARADLQEAVNQYQALTSQVAKEEADLVEEVENLDYRVLQLSKELRKLQSEEALVTTKQKRLDDELEQREIEFDFLLKNFKTYSSQFVNRLHVAEGQIFEDRLAEIERDAVSAGDNLSAEIRARIAALDLGARRLVALAGGHSFAGKAAGPSNTVEKGRFALFGPVGFFAGDDGKVVGMTAFQAGDVNIPSILEVDSTASGKVAELVKTGTGVVPVDGSLGKAFQIEEGKKSLREFLRAGGFVGYAIVLLGLMATVLSLFKLVEIARFRVPARSEINEILDELLGGREEEAVSLAKGLPGLAGRVVDAGARHFFAKRRVLEDALYEKLSAVQPRLERFLPFLAVIAAAAPMAGLLGTVLGIMKTFEMMAAFGTGDAKVTAGGIGEALITTFLGLLVAIPTIIVHGVLKSLARTRLGQVEGIAMAMINGTTEIVSKGELPAGNAKTSPQPDDDDDDLLEDLVIEPAT